MILVTGITTRIGSARIPGHQLRLRKVLWTRTSDKGRPIPLMVVMDLGLERIRAVWLPFIRKSRPRKEGSGINCLVAFAWAELCIRRAFTKPQGPCLLYRNTWWHVMPRVASIALVEEMHVMLILCDELCNRRLPPQTTVNKITLISFIENGLIYFWRQRTSSLAPLRFSTSLITYSHKKETPLIKHNETICTHLCRSSYGCRHSRHWQQGIRC